MKRPDPSKVNPYDSKALLRTNRKERKRKALNPYLGTTGDTKTVIIKPSNITH